MKTEVIVTRIGYENREKTNDLLNKSGKPDKAMFLACVCKRKT